MRVSRRVGRGIYVNSSMGEAIAAGLIHETVRGIFGIPYIGRIILFCALWAAGFVGMVVLVAKFGDSLPLDTNADLAAAVMVGVPFIAVASLYYFVWSRTRARGRPMDVPNVHDFVYVTEGALKHMPVLQLLEYYTKLVDHGQTEITPDSLDFYDESDKWQDFHELVLGELMSRANFEEAMTTAREDIVHRVSAYEEHALDVWKGK